VDRFTVVICGGGIAAVEGLLRLRSLVGDAVDVTLIAPNDVLRYRPLAVDEPFARRGVRNYPLGTIARRTEAKWEKDAVEWLDPDRQVVHTAAGGNISYDALLLAVGARLARPFEHVTVFDDAHADEAYHGLVQDVEGGYTRSVALVLPEGPAWLLPAYELALMTGERASSMGEEGLAVFLVTPEPAPMAALGDGASRAVAELLEGARARGCACIRTHGPRSPPPAIYSSAPRARSSRPSGSWPCPALRGARSATSRRPRTGSYRLTSSAVFVASASGSSPPAT
jgi:sulfide:quinone oxidoreductase